MASGEQRMGTYADRSQLLATRYSLFVRSMTIRTRKLIGTALLFVLAIVWSLLAMALAQSALTEVSYWTALLYYVVAGLGWVLPAMPLVKWMVKPDKPAKGERSE